MLDRAGPALDEHKRYLVEARVAVQVSRSLRPSDQLCPSMRSPARYRATQPGGAIDPASRTEIAAGLILQAVVLRHAWIGASGFVSDVIATRLSDAVHANALAMLGFDLRQSPLYGPRSLIGVKETAV